MGVCLFLEAVIIGGYLLMDLLSLHHNDSIIEGERVPIILVKRFVATEGGGKEHVLNLTGWVVAIYVRGKGSDTEASRRRSDYPF